MEGLGYYAPVTEKEYQDCLSSPFVQGKPDESCLNPRCRHRKKKGQLSTIALMPAEPVKGVHLFGLWGTDTFLIFQLCKHCYSIRVTNQCT